MDRPRTADHPLKLKYGVSTVIECIRLHGPISSFEISKRTGLDFGTVSGTLAQLADEGYIQEAALLDTNVGYPGVHLQFHPRESFAVALEIGINTISVVVTNHTGMILWRNKVPSRGTDTYRFERAETLIESALKYGKELALYPLGIGIGAPGIVDAKQGKLIYSFNPKWENIPIRFLWMRRFNVPVFVDRAANCSAMAEFNFGAARNMNNFIYINCGESLSSSIMVDGCLLRGSYGYGGEIGHITIYGHNGDRCECGRRGCWETYVSCNAIRKTLQRLIEGGAQSLLRKQVINDMNSITLKNVADAARKGDAVALSAIIEIGNHLGVGISNLINILNIDMVILGGPFSIFEKWLIPVIKETVYQSVHASIRANIQIKADETHSDACVLGASALVLKDIYREPVYIISKY